MTCDMVRAIPGLHMSQSQRVAAGCLALSALLSAQTASLWTVDIPPAVLGAVARIEQAQLRQDVEALTAPSMEGRQTPSPGLERAAAYLQQSLQQAGVEPQPGRAYRQRIPIVDRIWDRTNSSGTFDGKPLIPGEDFFPTPAVLDGSASGALVYVGHGFRVPARGIDPYAGLDLRGKILVTTTVRPRGLSPGDTPGTPGETWHDARTFGLANGAIGLVIIPNGQLQRVPASERLPLATQPRRSMEPLPIEHLPAIGASPLLIRTLFDGAGVSGDAVLQAAAEGTALPSFALPQQRRLTFTVALRKVPIEAANVIGVIPGRDTAAQHEHVIVGAHYDHLGVRERDGKAGVYPGADDNASGTASVVAIARALASAPRPRRSIMFVFFASEEWFHEGSRHALRAPVVPVSDIVTMINLDMVGRSRPAGEPLSANTPLSDPTEVYVQGARLTSHNLDERMRSVIGRYGSLALNASPDAPPYPDFWGSDHTAFAQAGVPTLYFSSGMHADHHQPTDTAEKLDYSKMRSVAHDVALLTWHLAEAQERPLKKPLPPELTTP